MELPNATRIHITHLYMSLLTHTFARTHRTLLNTFEHIKHCNVVILTQPYTFFEQKNLAFLLTFYHETKIGKSLRYILRHTFTQHTHTHGTKKLRRLYFYHTVFGVSFTQRLFIHMPFIFHTLEWSVT